VGFLQPPPSFPSIPHHITINPNRWKDHPVSVTEMMSPISEDSEEATLDRVASIPGESTGDCNIENTQDAFSYQQLPPFPHPIWKPHLAAFWLLHLAFGLMSLFAMLAFLAAIPVVNFLALGYLLEAEGRVARTGQLRHAVPLLALAPKLGSIAAGLWFWGWIVRLVADAASDARLIAPGSLTDTAWQIGLLIFSVGVALHLVLAIARGGRLSLFFWPTPLNALWLWKQLEQGPYMETAGIAISEFVSQLRLRHHFWLGLQGFGLAFVWLFFPTALFSALRDTSKPGQVIATLIGGAILLVVLTWVPFLQARFAAENRWQAMFELRAIRELYRKAPLVMFLSVIILYGLSLPLYLFKVAALPTDVYWLLTPIFIGSIYPAKILIGWTYAQANRTQRRAWRILRWSCTLLTIPLLGFYVFVLFFTPAIGAAGRAVLFQHHGILLPWPF
jgi:hypothetical protein